MAKLYSLYAPCIPCTLKKEHNNPAPPPPPNKTNKQTNNLGQNIEEKLQQVVFDVGVCMFCFIFVFGLIL